VVRTQCKEADGDGRRLLEKGMKASVQSGITCTMGRIRAKVAVFASLSSCPAFSCPNELKAPERRLWWPVSPREGRATDRDCDQRGVPGAVRAGSSVSTP